MSVEDNKRVFSEYTNAVYNEHAPERARDYLTPDVQWHAAQLGTLDGVESVVGLLQGFFAQVPDLRVIEHEVFGEGDLVGARITMEGTHEGDFLNVPATGRRLRWNAMDVCRFENGKISEEWGLDDFVSILQGMGACSTTPPWLGAGSA